MPELLSEHDYRAFDAAYKDFMRRHRETVKMLWGEQRDILREGYEQNQ